MFLIKFTISNAARLLFTELAVFMFLLFFFLQLPAPISTTSDTCNAEIVFFSKIPEFPLSKMEIPTSQIFFRSKKFEFFLKFLQNLKKQKHFFRKK